MSRETSKTVFYKMSKTVFCERMKTLIFEVRKGYFATQKVVF